VRYDAKRSSPFGWVVMMARSRAVDQLRRRTDSVTSELPERPVLSETSANVERDEVAGKIREALGHLPADQRGAINLAFYGGLTYEQVAAREQIPVGTAKTRIRLGLQKLRRLLNATEGNLSD
jgi:RNA polymerase sigma-70 factor, ECF subfamily